MKTLTIWSQWGDDPMFRLSWVDGKIIRDHVPPEASAMVDELEGRDVVQWHEDGGETVTPISSSAFLDSVALDMVTQFRGMAEVTRPVDPGFSVSTVYIYKRSFTVIRVDDGRIPHAVFHTRPRPDAPTPPIDWTSGSASTDMTEDGRLLNYILWHPQRMSLEHFNRTIEHFDEKPLVAYEWPRGFGELSEAPPASSLLPP